MALDGITIYSIVKELSALLINSKIDKISQAENDEILITTRGEHKTQKLLISASSSSPRIYIDNDYKKDNPLKAPMFLMILRKYIQGGRIKSISQQGMDRIIIFDIESLDDFKLLKHRSLVVEIMGRHSNIILVDKETNLILDSIKRIPITVSSVREVLPGKEYHAAPSQNKLDPITELNLENFRDAVVSSSAPVYKTIYMAYDGISPVIAREICFRASIDTDIKAQNLGAFETERLFNSFERLMNQLKNDIFYPCIVVDKSLGKLIDFSAVRLTMYEFLSIEHFDSISEATKTFFGSRDSRERMSQKNSSLRKLIQTKADRLKNKLSKQLDEVAETADMENYKRNADILSANMHQLKRGMKEISVQDFYSEDYDEITISLDENKTPSQNVQTYYKRYNKLKTRSLELASQIESAKAELDYLENILLSITEAETVNELEEIRIELANEGYIKTKSLSKKSKTAVISEPMCFRASDGTLIYAGKNNRQNDNLTLKLSASDDIWLHTKSIAGSHVIIKSSLDKVSPETLKEAAMISAYYSKARMSSNVPVDYAPRKNVKKPSGAKPGMVIYDNYSTIYVTPSEETIVKLRC